MQKLNLKLLPDQLGVYKLYGDQMFTEWPGPGDGFYSITRTGDEVSIVCRDEYIPDGPLSEKDFRAFMVEGPLDFGLTGILSSLLSPLAEAGISVFVLSTYDTDYILIKAEKLELAKAILNKTCTIK